MSDHIIERAEAFLNISASTYEADLISELIDELRSITGRQYPKRCQCCGDIREAAESPCKQCGCELEGPCE